MIPHTFPTWQSQNWQDELKQLIRDPKELFEYLQLPLTLLPNALRASDDFQLRVPRPYAARINKGNINDPLLRQVLPTGEELIAQPGYSHDPLGEAQNNPVPGVIHKYHGRLLLIVSGSCVINCRYCFRRHFPYSDNKPSRQEWQQALDYIRADSSLTEIILSGGDPLSSSNAQLQWLIDAIGAIQHVERLRIHTRLPIMIPSRIDATFLQMLQQTHLQTIMVIHCNHPQEIDTDVNLALRQLQQAGVTLLNQAVLLKGINDTNEVQIKLSQSLFRVGVLPYYLHLLDRVSGAHHFGVEEDTAKNLLVYLRNRLPGYLVPKLVREEAGAPSKTPIAT